MARRTLVRSLTLLQAIAVLTAMVPHAKAIESRTRSFVFSSKIRVPALPPKAKKLRLWIPLPETNVHQQISGLTITSPVPYMLHRDPEYGNRYAYLELTPAAGTLPLELQVRFRVKRREQRAPSDFSAGAIGKSQARGAELRRFLQPDRLVPTDGIIAQLALQQMRGLVRPSDKARAIYDYIVSTMRYDKSGEGWGRGDAIYACNVRKGNCTDFHALFIGMMRAAGIPARFEIGFPLPEDRSDGELTGYHCWAQFYLEGIGWVPVDASEAWKHPARRDYYFGALDPNRVLFSRGRDIRFNPAQRGDPLNYFVYPYAELDEKPYNGVEFSFSFRDIRAKGR